MAQQRGRVGVAQPRIGVGVRHFGFERITQGAVAAGFLDQDRATTWLEHLAADTFFASATIFVVTADI